MNLSSAQQVHTYKLCHTAFICMKYKRWKNVRALHVFGRAARTHFCAPELDASYLQLKRAAWIWWELAWGSTQMYVKWPQREGWSIASLSSSVFTEQNILSNLFIVQKNMKCINAISNSSRHSLPMNGRSLLVNRCLKPTEKNKLLKT